MLSFKSQNLVEPATIPQRKKKEEVFSIWRSSSATLKTKAKVWEFLPQPQSEGCGGDRLKEQAAPVSLRFDGFRLLEMEHELGHVLGADSRLPCRRFFRHV